MKIELNRKRLMKVLTKTIPTSYNMEWDDGTFICAGQSLDNFRHDFYKLCGVSDMFKCIATWEDGYLEVIVLDIPWNCAC